MLIHTPRTFFSVAKGLARRRHDPNSGIAGVGEKNVFVTHARVGLFDTDYLFHLNNAAYLNHSEYARWELCAYNGLMESMYRDKVSFMVGGAAVRFRREIRPVFRKFEVHTFVAHMDERYFWFLHTFRYPPGGPDPGRIRGQCVCQGLVARGRNVLNPREYLINSGGFDPGFIDEVMETASTNTTMQDIMEKYLEMEDKLKVASALDDERILNQKKDSE